MNTKIDTAEADTYYDAAGDEPYPSATSVLGLPCCNEQKGKKTKKGDRIHGMTTRKAIGACREEMGERRTRFLVHLF
ncbi:hypothetical protein GCM10011391_14690 [Pullulanibacillus camelliae]|uniref:Uncharacterized protein n=1 Tax=Pullulanibacillus camelliae TaxID=1707096 RepID=A0A8J2YG53_9BACL|nr:hypothetical protein GCM10011391_14690 [Pullulanibacillus camelliae]